MSSRHRQFKRERIRNKLPELYEKHGSCCFYCKAKVLLKHITIDHLEPRKNIPLDKHPHRKNKVFACKDCNSGLKGSLSIYFFRERVVKELVEILKSKTSINKKWNSHKIQKVERYKTIIKTCTMILREEIKDFCF